MIDIFHKLSNEIIMENKKKIVNKKTINNTKTYIPYTHNVKLY